MQKFEGRYAGRYDKDFILYVFGLRINKLWKVREWWGVMKYSYKMRTYLLENPQHGMLAAERGFIHGSLCVLTYWRSFEDLERFARDKDNLHVSGWRWYNTQAHRTGAVAMWHEMYTVPAGQMSGLVGGLYSHMPRVGLAKIGEHIPVGSTLRTAAQRMGKRIEDSPPEEVPMHDDEYEAVDRAIAERAAAERNGSPVAS